MMHNRGYNEGGYKSRLSPLYEPLQWRSTPAQGSRRSRLKPPLQIQNICTHE